MVENVKLFHNYTSKTVVVIISILAIFTLIIAACTSVQDSSTPELSDTTETKTDSELSSGLNGESSPESYFESPDVVENSYIVEDAFPGITFTRPLDIQHAGDGSGRVFVVEQAGKIYVIRQSGTDIFERELFLDITTLVNDSGNEQGLLGLAFHPQYIQNGFFFVNYTNRNGTVISRFSISEDPNVADTGSEFKILEFSQPFSNHNGGGIAFGQDGFLYIAAGDGGGGGDPQNHGQNPRSLHGNILRIDVDNNDPGLNYAIPEDNPFVGNTEGFREEIFAYGLRNPWRFSFDVNTGVLWAADVGQNAVEEINIIENGKNYGWNIMEGTRVFAANPDVDPDTLVPPVYEYYHPLGRSITGGYVYRGKENPELYGAYIYGDFVTGIIWGLWYKDNFEPVNITLTQTDLRISSFGVDENNEIYIASFDGSIYRLIR